MTAEAATREQLLEELAFLRAEEERLQGQVEDYYARIHKAADKLEALRNLVEMAQHASAKTTAGVKGARVYAEEILGILDSKEYLT